jgi:hypothetical protein
VGRISLCRPVGQVAKTRFKTWWQLCGYPVELAAELIGETIDIASLLSTAEKGEAETTAAGVILNELMGAFPDAVVQHNRRVDDEKKFFARDVSRLIAAGERRSDGTEPQEADKFEWHPLNREVGSVRAKAASAARRNRKGGSRLFPAHGRTLRPPARGTECAALIVVQRT